MIENLGRAKVPTERLIVIATAMLNMRPDVDYILAFGDIHFTEAAYQRVMDYLWKDQSLNV